MSTTPPGDAPSPRRPTGDDIELLSFAQQFELAARDLYDAALEAGGGDAATRAVFAALRENHEQYAGALGALLGVEAPNRPDEETVTDRVESFASDDVAAVAEAGFALESELVANHHDFVGQVRSTDASRVLSSILLVEAQHATVLADLAGNGDDLDAMLGDSLTGTSA